MSQDDATPTPYTAHATRDPSARKGHLNGHFNGKAGHGFDASRLLADGAPVVQRGALEGFIAALLSTAVLAWRGRVDTGSAAAPINAPSQWLWGDEALAHDEVDWKHTAAGHAIHHLSALLWGLLFEGLQRARRRRTVATVVTDAAAVTALAAAVDLKLVPDRLTPGFEKRLSSRSVALVYGGFGLGLAAAGLWLLKRR
jgi:hypothetical protein